MHTRKMKVVGRSVSALAIGVALTVGSASIASASSHHDNAKKNHDCASGRVSSFDYANVGRGGYVTAVTSTTVTVAQWGGTTTTYTLSPTTTYTEGKSPSTIASLVVGDRVNVQTSSSAPTTATSVNIELAMLFGKVSGVSGNTITITGPQGFTRTIVVSSATTYSVHVTASAPGSGALSDVTVGSIIVASGTIDANQTSLDAVSIDIGAAASSTQTIRGVVTAVTSSSVTVQSHSGTTTTFTFTTTTTFKVGSTTLSVTDLAVGERVGVQVNTAAATTALNIEIHMAHLNGKVTAVGATTITVAGPQGFSRVINVSSSTKYSEKGATATFADVVVGARVRAEGTIDANQTSLDATSVVICPAAATPTPTVAPQQKSNSGTSGKHGHHGLGGRGHGRGHNRR